MATLLRTRSVYPTHTPQVFHIALHRDTETPGASAPTQPNVDHGGDDGRGKTHVLVYTCSVRQRDERTNTETE